MKNIVIDVVFMKVLVSYLQFTKSVSFATSSPTSFFLFFFKYLSCLLYNREFSDRFTQFLITFNSYLCYFIYFFFHVCCCLKKNFWKNCLAHLTPRVHISKMMQQAWSKANYWRKNEARYQNFLLFLRRCVNVASLLLHLLHPCSHRAQYWRRHNAEVAQMQISVNQV